MFNPTALVIDGFVRRLEATYLTSFDASSEPSYPGLIAWIARTALERIADSDALYHTLDHTLMVTLVGQEILRGKDVRAGGVTPADWLHFTAALLCHDIGYVRGACLGDRAGIYVIDGGGHTVRAPPGASDAFLARHHVDRGKLFVRERFAHIDALDIDRLCAALELTCFPIPDDADHQATDTEPGLVRAADLIGHLADPHYMRKVTGLFYEFKENGTADALGYESAADLAERYPKFYWSVVRPYISTALDYLRVTQDGKQWIANLYAHVFAAEHREFQLGPEREHLTNRAPPRPSGAHRTAAARRRRAGRSGGMEVA